MTLTQQDVPDRRRVVFLPSWREVPSWNRAALLVRLTQLVAGIALFWLPEHHHLVPDVLLGLGVPVAAVSPARNGPALALIGAVLAWVFSDGLDTAPPTARVLLFALAVFVLHNATALAATAPLTGHLRPEVVRRWLRRSGLSLVVSAVLILLVYLVRAITAGTATPVLQLVGVIGVLVIVTVGALLFSRRLRAG
jgi:hypothetical protein